MTTPRAKTPRATLLSRRALLVGGAGALAACASAPEQLPVADNVHPLAGLVDFAGAPVPTPPMLGSVTLIDFWASWCAPCRMAFPHLDQLFRTYQGDGLDVIAVSVDDDPVAARRFWASMRPHFKVAWDKSGAVRARFKLQGLPTTMLFDAEGFIVQRNEGFALADHRLLEEHVHRLLR
ncbi:MAG: TlpA family protein disulfide reductase [Deltaproteobacteria bacterium]|nr:TlpA family protein disulfide reductase [Deltaproteobacteria bacterium]